MVCLAVQAVLIATVLQNVDEEGIDFRYEWSGAVVRALCAAHTFIALLITVDFFLPRGRPPVCVCAAAA